MPQRTNAFSMAHTRPVYNSCGRLLCIFNPAGEGTATRQMTMNGKRDGFTLADFRACAKSALLKRGRAEAIVAEVRAAGAKWPEFAEQARVAADGRKTIGCALLLELA